MSMPTVYNTHEGHSNGLKLQFEEFNEERKREREREREREIDR